MHDIVTLPAFRLAEEIQAGTLKPSEVIQAHLQHINRVNPLINAFVELAEETARSTAKWLDGRTARGEAVGPLHGIPVGIKDLEDVQGLRTTYGSVPFAHNVAVEDSVHVARLRSSGAVPVGKTNTSEFGYAAFTKNRLHGVSRNPWDLTRTPGGSSGGSAAAVAARLVPIATGTDRGGSLRIPAAYTACFAIKPTFGRIPRGPSLIPQWSDLEVIGPVTRTVRDAALYLDVVSGHDPVDKDSLPSPDVSFTQRLQEPVPRLRLGWTPDLGYAAADPAVLAVCEEALRDLEGLGHHVDHVELDLPDPSRAWACLGAAERYGELHDLLASDTGELGRGFREGVERGRSTTPVDIAEAQRARANLIRTLSSVFERFDLLLTPTTPTVAFDAEGRLPERIADRIVTDPTQVVAFTYPFNLSGHPAATVRAGMVAGLPVGLQIIGPYHQEALIMQVAYEHEVAVGYDWPVLPTAPS